MDDGQTGIRFEKDSLHLNAESLDGPEVGFEEIAIDLLQARFWGKGVLGGNANLWPPLDRRLPIVSEPPIYAGFRMMTQIAMPSRPT